jgi:3-oxoacyl-[acyl-carrier protein] reductase
MNKTNLNGKKILITGASKGIGKATALALAEEGAELFLTARSVSTLEAVADDVVRRGGQAVVLPADLTDPAGPEKLADAVKESTGGLDVLVNNAGTALSASFEDSRPEDWDRIMTLNARSPYFLTRALLPVMESSEIKTVINIASVVAYQGYPLQSVYTASKHALIGFSKSLARELQTRGYRIHVISPGGVATDMVSGVRPDINTEELISPDELAEWIRFLLTARGKGMADHICLRRESKFPW